MCRNDAKAKEASGQEKKLAAVPVKLSPISLTLQHAAKIEQTLVYRSNHRPKLG
jgi:hypothetical protein